MANFYLAHKMHIEHGMCDCLLQLVLKPSNKTCFGDMQQTKEKAFVTQFNKNNVILFL